MLYRKAFTLIEIMMVVAIIGILAMIAIPRLSKVYEKARVSEGVQLLTSLRAAQGRYCLDHEDCGTANYPSPCSKLDLTVAPTNFNAPTCAADGTITIVRSTAIYTLSVNAAGTVTCTPSSGPTCDQTLLRVIPATM